MKILTLSGFLGVASDFDPLMKGLKEQGLFFQDQNLSICESSLDQNSWGSWVTEQAILLRQWKGQELLVGIGYSLGGRLLLSLIQEDPQLFDGAVFLSVNPGLRSETEIQERLRHDEIWARRFETEEPDSLLKDWGAQAVFAGAASEPVRFLDHYPNGQLPRVMRIFSLGHQPNFRPMMKEWPKPQLWLAGEKDAKFLSLIENVQAVYGASHRLLWDQPQAIVTAVGGWIHRQAWI